MKTFKLNPEAPIKRVTVFGRLCEAKQTITMGDKDAKKYLDHKINGVATFVECAPINSEVQVTETSNLAGTDGHGNQLDSDKAKKVAETENDDTEQL